MDNNFFLIESLNCTCWKIMKMQFKQETLDPINNSYKKMIFLVR
jgi:hypothetical protein